MIGKLPSFFMFYEINSKKKHQLKNKITID